MVKKKRILAAGFVAAAMSLMAMSCGNEDKNNNDEPKVTQGSEKDSDASKPAKEDANSRDSEKEGRDTSDEEKPDKDVNEPTAAPTSAPTPTEAPVALAPTYKMTEVWNSGDEPEGKYYYSSYIIEFDELGYVFSPTLIKDLASGDDSLKPYRSIKGKLCVEEKPHYGNYESDYIETDRYIMSLMFRSEEPLPKGSDLAVEGDTTYYYSGIMSDDVETDAYTVNADTASLSLNTSPVNHGATPMDLDGHIAIVDANITGFAFGTRDEDGKHYSVNCYHFLRLTHDDVDLESLADRFVCYSYDKDSGEYSPFEAPEGCECYIMADLEKQNGLPYLLIGYGLAYTDELDSDEEFDAYDIIDNEMVLAYDTGDGVVIIKR